MNFKKESELRIEIGAIVTTMIVGLALLSSCSSEQKKARADAIDSIQETEVMEEATENSDESYVSLPESLEECEAYSEIFTHPMTGEELEREVVGLDAEGYCEYKEEMPDNGLMTCKYSEETRIVLASYYENEASFGSFGSVKVTYKMDGKTVENPLNEVMKNGTCTISGY